MRTPVILANAGVPMLMLAFPAAFFLLIPVVGIANIYSYALLIVFGLIWLLYAIVDHHYRREV
jgi:hypothetical protein